MQVCSSIRSVISAAVAPALAAMLATTAAARDYNGDRPGYQRGHIPSTQWYGGHADRGYNYRNDSGPVVPGRGARTWSGGARTAPPPVYYSPRPYYYDNYRLSPFQAYPYAKPPPVYFGD
jgi:hypothetical protein